MSFQSAIDLRDYQIDANDRIRALIDAGKRRIALCMATGGGKTVTFSAFIHERVREGDRALVIVHRRELITQAVDKLRRFDIEPGVILAGHPPEPARKVQVASIQTLARRDLPPADLIVPDEAHHSRAPSWRRIFAAYPNAIIVGPTATPWGLAEIFQEIVIAATPGELIQGGALSRYKAMAFNAPKLHEVPIVAGEFHQGKLALAMNTKVIVGNVTKEFLSYHRGRRALLFPVNIEGSLMHVADLRIHGISAEHIDGNTKPEVRAEILRRLECGTVQVVSSVGCFTEGFDCPAVEIAVLIRPTMSLVLALQMQGRAMRPAAGKDHALIVDHGGNLLRHGLVDDEDREYSLNAPPALKRELYACPLCRAVFRSYGDDGSCPKCQQLIAPPREIREAQDRRKQEIEAQERLDAERIRELRKQKLGEHTLEKRREKYRELQKIAAAKGYKPNWAAVQFQIRYGHWPNFGSAA